MYEIIKNKIVHAVTHKRVILGVLSVLIICFACSLLRGYLDTRTDYQRTREQLERTQRALDDSRKLNQQLKASIAASQQLNSDAGRRIEQAQDYQRETGAGIERLETNQRETSSRIGEGLEYLDAARSEIERSLDIIERVESGNKE
nr:MAG TPA: cell division protein [Caudoviricetes sp.]